MASVSVFQPVMGVATRRPHRHHRRRAARQVIRPFPLLSRKRKAAAEGFARTCDLGLGGRSWVEPSTVDAVDGAARAPEAAGRLDAVVCAFLAGGGVGPLAGDAGRREADEQGPALGAVYVAAGSVAALPAAVGKVASADLLGAPGGRCAKRRRSMRWTPTGGQRKRADARGAGPSGRRGRPARTGSRCRSRPPPGRPRCRPRALRRWPPGRGCRWACRGTARARPGPA